MNRRQASAGIPRRDGCARRGGGGRRPHAAPFTLVEVLVVLAILALITGLVLPRVGKLPEGLRADTCTGTLDNAFRDSALRARATGATVLLELDAENERFTLREIIPSSAAAPPAASAGADGGAGPAESRFSGEKEYPLPNGIEWNLDQWDTLKDGPPGFTFFPNGECGGVPLEFSTGNRKFRLGIDRLTGTVLVTELTR